MRKNVEACTWFILGLIPSRIGSKRLPAKALLPIGKIPLVIHTYKRAKLSKKLDDLIICCDSKEIMNAAKKNGVKILTIFHNWDGPTTKGYKTSKIDYAVSWNTIMKNEI